MATADDRPDDRPARRRDDDRASYEEPHRGVLILILGILSVVTCPILGLFAWIMGNKDQKAMAEGRMDPAGRSNTQVGKVLGIVGTVLLVLWVIGGALWVVMLGFFLANAPAVNAPPPNAQPVFKAGK